MSNSVPPHRRQPTRLPSPWESPGKNTGVGCHFLLQCMKVKSESEVAQSCPTPSDPMVCSLPGSSVHGIFQGRVLEWGVIAFSVLVAYFIPNSLQLLLLYPYIVASPFPFLMSNHYFSISESLFLITFTPLLYSLDSTCKWYHDALQVSPCCRRWQNFILCNGLEVSLFFILLFNSNYHSIWKFMFCSSTRL